MFHNTLSEQITFLPHIFVANLTVDNEVRQQNYQKVYQYLLLVFSFNCISYSKMHLSNAECSNSPVTVSHAPLRFLGL